MAKKTSKAKKAKGKEPSQELIRQVFGECAVAVGRGIEETAQKNGVKIEVESDAIKHWAERYWKTIPNGLRAGKWSNDRGMVLLQAWKMGRNAATAAVEKPGEGGRIAITLSDAKAASVFIEKDPLCQVHVGKKVPHGRYCDPKYVKVDQV